MDSFFDHVETSIANAEYLEAKLRTVEPKLDLAPYASLRDFESALRADGLSFSKVSSQPIGFYFLRRFLIEDGKQSHARFLEAAAEYLERGAHERRQLAGALLNDFMQLLLHDPDPDDSLKRMEASLEACLTRPSADTDTDDAAAARVVGEARAMVRDRVLARFPAFVSSSFYERFVRVLHYSTRPVSEGDFLHFRVLGRGAFGAVSASQKRDTRAIFAVKQQNKRRIKARNAMRLCVMEKRLLASVNSPFVLSLHYAFHDRDNVYLVVEMCSGGDLRYHLRHHGARKPFSTAQARFYAAQMLLGLEAIHECGYVYRDLKPANVLLRRDGNVVISDMGLAIKLLEDKPLVHLAGTAGYWAPETVARKPTVPASDLWSWAVTLYEMLLGKRPSVDVDADRGEWSPFGVDEVHTENAKQGGRAVLLPNMPAPFFTPHARDLLEKMFVEEPAARLTPAQIEAHPFFEGLSWGKLARLELDPPFVPGDHEVHAQTLDEVGEFSTERNGVVTKEDEEVFAREFSFTNQKALQEELVRALQKLDEPVQSSSPSVSRGRPKDCCIVN